MEETQTKRRLLRRFQKEQTDTQPEKLSKKELQQLPSEKKPLFCVTHRCDENTKTDYKTSRCVVCSVVLVIFLLLLLRYFCDV